MGDSPLDRLKNTYFALEDKWYAFLEGLDERLPFRVTSITDPIDKIVPSFAVAVTVSFVLLAAVAFILFAPGMSNVTLTFQDEQGNILDGAAVEIIYGGEVHSLESDEFGRVSFTVPLNTEITITASKTGFDAAEETLVAVSPEIRYSILMQKKPELVERTLLLQSSNGQLLDGVSVTVKFSCSNSTVTPPADQTTTTGIIRVTPPPNCGRLLAEVIATGYQTLSSIELKELSKIISLQEAAADTGIVKVTVVNEDNERLDDIRVSLYRSNSLLENQSDSVYGLVNFEGIATGTYYVSASDPSQGYASQSSDDFTVSKDQTSRVTVTLSEVVNATLNVLVEDANSGQKVSGALVELMDGLSVVEGQRTDANGEVKLNIHTVKDYTLRVTHNDYLYGLEAVSLRSGSNSITVELEKITPENSGRVHVTVLDEDLKPVENAEISVYNAETELLYPLASIPVTDTNGVAEMAGLRAGEYYVVASKFPVQGQSPAKAVNIREVNYFEVNLLIGDGEVAVRVLDTDGEPIPFARVEFFAETGTSLGALETDALGVKSYLTKADKKVYVRVSKEGYSSFTSMAYQVYPQTQIPIKAVLERTITGNKPQITFLGLYENEYGQKVDIIEAGNAYLAKLQVKVPGSLDLDALGVHFRVGELELLANEPLQVKQVNAPEASKMRGSSYHAPDGWSEDEENLVFGEAKWVNLRYNSPREGVYEIGFTVSVKASTPPGRKLGLHYRAWGEDFDDDFLRDPLDAELGTARESGSKEELYAYTYDKYYWEGREEVCSEDFCYGGERVFDTLNELYLSDRPYNAFVFADNILYFDIANNSDVVYTDAKLTVTNVTATGAQDDVLRISEYEIVNANAQVFSADSLEVYIIDNVSLGEFTRGKSVTGAVHLQPITLEDSFINLKLVSGGSVVFTETIPFKPVKTGILDISIEPEDIFAFEQIDIELLAEDNGMPVSGVNLVVRKQAAENPAIVSLVGIDQTDVLGRAQVSWPASSPGSKAIITAEKPGYQAPRIIKEISGEVVTFSPDFLTAELEVVGARDDTENVQIKNLTAARLNVWDVFVNADFGGLVNKDSVESFARLKLKEQLASLDPFETVTTPVLKVQLEQDIIEPVNTEIEGTIYVYLRDEAQTRMYVQELPFTVVIGVGGGVQTEGCLTVSVGNWDTVSLGQRVLSPPIYIKNQCVSSGGRRLELKNLMASVDWQGNVNGELTMRMNDLGDQFGGEASLGLFEGRDSVFFENVRFDEYTPADYEAIIEFMPLAGHDGEDAEFTVSFDAEVLTDDGWEKVGASRGVRSNIRITNMIDCVSFTGGEGTGTEQNPFLVRRDEKSVEVTASLDCGNEDLEIKFCGGQYNDRCRGNTGETESGVRILTAEDGGDSWERDIEGDEGFEFAIQRGRNVDDIPGIYQIPITATIKGTRYVDLPLPPLYVIIEPKEKYANKNWFYFDNSNYSLYLGDVGGKVSVPLYNEMVIESSRVTASYRFWGRALNWIANEEPWIIWAEVTLYFGILTAPFGGILSWWRTTRSDEDRRRTEDRFHYGYVVNLDQKDYTTEILVKPGPGESIMPFPTSERTAPPVLADPAQCNAYCGISGQPTVQQSWCYDTCISRAPYDPNQPCASFGGLECHGAETCVWPDNNPRPFDRANDTDKCCLSKCLASEETTPKEGKIRGYWVEGVSAPIETVSSNQPNGLQMMEVEFENAGLQPQAPAFRVVEVSAKNWDRGDVYHLNNYLNCGDNVGEVSYFMYSNVCGASFVSHKEKFHFMFKTIDTETGLPPFEFDRYDCRIGNLRGVTGPGAVPKVKFDWDWDSIDMYSCDASDPEAFYCDATQFATMMAKRIHAIDALLEKNDFLVGVCPDQPASSLETGNDLSDPESAPRFIPIDKAGLVQLENNFSTGPNTLVSTLKAKSGTSAPSSTTITLTAKLIKATDNSVLDRCDFNVSINAGQSLERTCSFEYLSPGIYIVEASASGSATDAWTANLQAVVTDLPITGPTACWLPRSTGLMHGQSLLQEYIDAGAWEWTDSGDVDPEYVIGDENALKDLLSFDALLIKDGYSMDFREDFVRYFEQGWLASDTFFANDADDRNLKEYFLTPSAFSIERKGSGEEYLFAPGKYRVELEMNFQDDWELFDTDGRPKADIRILTSFRGSPNPNSPFYSLPFDGKVGLEGGALKRSGYGTQYNNTDEALQINQDIPFIETYDDGGSAAMYTLETKQQTDLLHLSAIPATRGNLLSLENTSDTTKSLSFNPSYATPVLMKVVPGDVTASSAPIPVGQPAPQASYALAFYSLISGGQPASTGPALTRWEGVGNCRDFSGLPVYEAFDYRWDRPATANDPLPQIVPAYGVDWAQVVLQKPVFLRTIFYTPRDKESQLTSLVPTMPPEDQYKSAVTFTSSNDFEQTAIALNGVLGMAHNRPGSGTSDTINSIETIFEMVDANSVCVTDTGIKSVYWWNPKALYDFELPGGTSLSDRVKNIDTQGLCEAI